VIVAESRRVRRLVGRLDKGSEILEALAEVCRTHQVRAAEVRAIGSLEQVVLTEYEQRARQYRPGRRFDAQFEIVTLNGNISEKDGKVFVHAKTSLSRERDNGIELVGGQLQSGRVFAVEFVIDVFEDLILRRSPDAQTGLSLWREAISLADPTPSSSPSDDPPPPKPDVPFETPARTSWEDVVAASDPRPAARPERQEAPVEETPYQEEVHVTPGDLIDHPKFGRCVVERVEGDYEFVSARLRNQRLIRLSLDVLTLVPAGEEGGKRLFRAVMGA
jgi:predicted DNA-binding protein with PD1-like motif